MRPVMAVFAGVPLATATDGKAGEKVLGALM